MAVKLMIFVKNVLCIMLCIVLGFFIPLIVSALVSSIYFLLQHPDNSYAEIFSLFLLWAVLFSGVQSIIYSFIMNLTILLNPKKTKNIILTSSILGGLSGLVGILVLNLIIDRTFHLDLEDFYIILLGFVVGVISGYLLLKIRSFLF
ncbi:hypothetical protein LVY74_15015 [Acinetobacter sp. ME22]|uniref:hypothetical protein n=1 Tax=Acinetobacter sp. ME22 TaxID=2904802 RepID=UPI001EDBD641|nr:hypothetical protein [Acinetobacter sp. ME22]MCG2574856.1 hypothetical protein [Acinetobacter sp. ME22]